MASYGDGMTDRDDFLRWVKTALYEAELALHNCDAAHAGRSGLVTSHVWFGNVADAENRNIALSDMRPREPPGGEVLRAMRQPSGGHLSRLFEYLSI